ncbi:hypothetical protein H632_c2386p0, partial [Helicosporidium sp. ATCC 50920]
EVCTYVDMDDYPFTGSPIYATLCGQDVVGLYVGSRLVGFAKPNYVTHVTAEANGVIYPVKETPSPAPSPPPPGPLPPIPPSADITILYNGRVVGATSGGLVPIFLPGSDGPEAVGFELASDYPYTGQAYTILRYGQVLTSMYIGTRLVGFAPAASIDQMQGSYGGRQYPITKLPGPPAPPAPPAPPTPLPPVPPQDDVEITYKGTVVGSTSGSQVPVFIDGPNGAQYVESVDSSAYPYTGRPYSITRQGQVLVSIYLGTRLVGFASPNNVSDMAALWDGRTYAISMIPSAMPPPMPPSPSPPSPPLPPSADVEILYRGEVVGSTSGSSVPVLGNVGGGLAVLTTVDASNYPYTGYAYTLEQDGQLLTSIYIGQRLVGFAPANAIPSLVGAWDSHEYSIVALPDPPAPPTPPLPPGMPVDLLYLGTRIATATSDDVPVIISGDGGPVVLGYVNVDDYPYTGYSYEIERNGQTLVSVYVGERLVGFVPKGETGDYSASSGGKAYPVNVLPDPPTPPLPPGATVDILYGGKVIGSTGDNTVPVIVDGPNGPVLLENIDVADYPYTGYSYEIERDGQTLVSIYVGETLVGFVPKDQA